MTTDVLRRARRFIALLLVAGFGSLPIAPQVSAQSPKQPTAQSTLRKSAGANPRLIEIVSDSLGETEFRIADEIAGAVASTQETGPNGEVALRVTPVVSPGGIQAVRDVLTLPNADFGIASARVLDRLNATRELGDLKDRITYVTPLYVEEVHLIAGFDVRSLADLQGGAVSIGKDESATQIIAREILSAGGLKVREERLELRDAVAAIKAGEIAAAFLVSGKPVDGLKALAPGEGLRLVPVTLPSPPAGYLPSTLVAEDYPELLGPGERVATLGVQNVLFAYNWPSKSPRAQLGDFFLNSLFQRLSNLQKPPRHPKWQEVNLAGTVPGYRRLAAMEAWLKRSAPQQAQQTLKSEFEQFVKERGLPMREEDREALFQNFLRWRGEPATTGSR
ncbi:MAG TPA: TAXI family TRAP transporter solute-binding subunit [Microvirga sp.]|jgi:TRAP-type uncharacterized transport system substrate-binding protein|nr:TAXI family TRAP transporter solute-binding subunit [Microvirga sp.]